MTGKEALSLILAGAKTYFECEKPPFGGSVQSALIKRDGKTYLIQLRELDS